MRRAVRAAMVWLLMAASGTGLVTATGGGVALAAAPDAREMEQLIERLPYLDLHSMAGQFSSRDRSGGNHDWSDEMAGRAGYLYKDEKGERVLAELRGSGELNRLWFTGIGNAGNIRIYIDDPVMPKYDLPVRQLFAGTTPPFVGPFVYDDEESSGGFVSYVRIPFTKYFKLTTTGEPAYYQIGYRLSPVGEPAGPQKQEEGRLPHQLHGSLSVEPGQALTLLDLPGPATITSFVLHLPDGIVRPAAPARRVFDGGRAFTGYSTFLIRLQPDNDGAKLVRRLDYGIGDQTARVFVDGQLAGIWSTPGVAIGYNWRDAEFEIPAEFTRGKSSARVRVEFVSSRIDWNEFYYWVYSRSGSEWVLTDVVDVGNVTSERSHSYQITGETWRGERDFEYPPEATPDAEQLQASLRTLDSLWLEIQWDQQVTPAVKAPLDLFFATPVGPHPVDSALIQVRASDNDGITLISRIPMPFGERAMVRLINNGSERVCLRYEVAYFETPESPSGLADGELGYFHATYRREFPTTPGQDYTVLQAEGAGKLVGVVMRLAGPPNRWYLEGDEHIWIDGNLTARFSGTGTEDHFGGGWYFNRGPFSLLFHGAPGHTVVGTQDVTSVYRFFVTDAVPFRAGIKYTLEHGGMNDAVGDYESVAFWYGVPGDALKLTDQFRPHITEEAAAHGWEADGTVRFRLAVDASNCGVILRRRVEEGKGRQEASVYADGELAGVWFDPEIDTAQGPGESDFLIPAYLTRGKSSLEIVIEPRAFWSATAYAAYSLVRPVSD